MRGACRVLYVGKGRDHAERLAQQRPELTVTVATSGADCLARELAGFDCLVIRDELPEMTGVDLLEQVQRRTPDIPVILVAESGDEAVASAAITAGVTDYLSEPDQYATLAARVLHYGAQSRDGSTARTPGGDTDDGLKSAAMDSAPAGIVITDPSLADNPIVYANERFTDLTGYEQAAVEGRNCRFLQGPATEEEPVAELREALRTETPVTVELRNYRADGTEFWNEVRVRPLRNADGEVTHYVGFQQDITDRKRRERALREERALTRAIFDALPDAFVVFDTDGNCLRWSESIAAVTGYSESEIAEMGPTDLIADSDVDQVEAALDAVLSGGSERTLELDIETKDGHRLPYEVAVARISEGDGTVLGAVVTGRDISERQARTAELKAKNTRLEKFARVISHDIRNPLQVADGQLTLAQSKCESPHLDRAQEALGRMETLIDELLTLAREGKVVTEREPVAVDELVQRCWSNVETGDARLDCTTETVVQADPGRLQEVFENLFRNAAEHGSASPPSQARQDSVEHGSTSNRTQSDDAIEHGAPRERDSAAPDQRSAESGGGDSESGGDPLTIAVGATETGLYVADDGQGIPAGDRTQIFESGYSTADGGTGYGLNIVREIVEAHGWTIDASESATGGARFDIDLGP